ncbi:unnamed protein product [Vitrella brassicaformis CCMP3155]|uniref:Cyclin-dependent kinases regulatory subunit n=2 Tax=Vitrella brassicaformis TaxID=1169539 RepID=A0A0G4EEF9_VITBC|nr:unnamed protein product [Vitrella brassicaformis CCMP3155]|mmetsp:Transcript_12995/g.37655  ORF Transcript_12995/g.37655 Transcript_12995/m.37655 type:complete len:129 (+) Transcript_12995:75-461(+)|eukprot:CEL94378.1 unnamed protein product [Vitrella brassicaformis CCMP3155]
MPHYPDEIEYSEKYDDGLYEYRHVILPRKIYKKAVDARNRTGSQLLSEAAWRSLGVQQSMGWENYEVFEPEPHILLFRRPLRRDNIAAQQQLQHMQQMQQQMQQMQQMQQVQYAAAHGAGVVGGRQMN